MRLFTHFRLWIRAIFRRSRVESDMDAELRSHIEAYADDLMRTGITRNEALCRARLEFGGIARVKEECRESRGISFIESAVQDLRFAFRMLRKSPGFTAVAILTLALGIGANTAIFSLTDQVLLRLLPVQHPEQLVVLRSTENKAGRTFADYDLRNSFSYPMYKNLRDHNHVFSGLLACFQVDVSLARSGRAEIAHGELVSGNFFNVLGVRPILGRLFSSADETSPGANPVAVLNYAYWTSHFGGDPSILDKPVSINGFPFTVVGVAQPNFNAIQAGAQRDLYVPITMKAEMTPGWKGLDNPFDYFLPIMGRLNPGMTPERAQASLQPLFHSFLEAEFPVMVARWGAGATEDRARFIAGKINVSPGAYGRPVLQHYFETPLLFLSAMVGLVLLIACANLACLLIARGESRRHEVAVRLALGAGRGRVVRQLLTESLLVSAAGGIAGLLLGWAALASTISLMPSDPGTAMLNAHLDIGVLSFAAAATTLSGLLCGVFPALRASRTNLRSAFSDQGAHSTGGAGSIRLRKSLIVAQVAMTAMLLVAAGLFGESLIRTERVNLGMRIGHIVEFDFAPGLSRYSPAQTLALFKGLDERLAALPGVTSVSAAEQQLLAGGMEIDTVNYEGYTFSKGDDDYTNPWVNHVEPNFFSTLGIPLLQGRAFRDSDSPSSTKVAIISQSIARRCFAGRNPIGFHLGFANEAPHFEIVGVVADARQNDPRWAASPSVYFPSTQDTVVNEATFYVRTSLPPSTLIPTLRGVVARFAPDVAASNFETLTEQLNSTVSDERLVTFFTVAFALLAAVLACVGLYGVMAYVVTRRTREIGIRVALGASRGGIARMVLWQAGQLALIGVAIGISAAVPLVRLIRSQLFEVKPGNPLVFLFSASLLILVALVACYIPARRAMKVDPMVALRHE